LRLPEDRGFGLRRGSTWAALSLGAAFLILGIGFAAAPRFGAWIFGIETEPGSTLAYVRAIGFRDIALAFYIFGLIAFGTRRGLSVVLAASLVIPACDVALVLSVSGWRSIAQVFVHLAGAASLAIVAVWLRAGDSPPRPNGADGRGQG
jgi:hypothetical protein